MDTDADIDDEEFSSDELDAEAEALLYSRIHHQEKFETSNSPPMIEGKHFSLTDNILSVKKGEMAKTLLQTDSGICSPKNSRSPSPLEVSRLQSLSTSKGRLTQKNASNSSSDDDDGIKVEYENVGKLKEYHVSQEKNVSVYVQSVKNSSESSSEESESFINDIKLNITEEETETGHSSFQSIEDLIGKSSHVAESSLLKPQSWTDQMNQFYNDVNHAVKNKTMEEILSELPDDPRLWEVNLEDRSGLKSSFHERGRYFKKPLSVRCNNCRERGHLSKACPSPRKQITCSMCGGHHRETRCDQSMCLRCGEPNRIYTRGCHRCLKLDKFRCAECFCFGHDSKACPNVWRQFHLTVLEGQLVRVNEFVPPEDKWCPNCAKKGHYLHQCSAYLVSPYPASIGHVVNYSSGNASNANIGKELPKKLTRRERFKRRKELAIKRKIFSKPNKKDLDTSVLNALISKSKRNGRKSKRKASFKKDSNIETPSSSKPRRKRKKVGKGKIQIFN